MSEKNATNVFLVTKVREKENEIFNLKKIKMPDR